MTGSRSTTRQIYSCLGKIRYRNYSAADNVRRRMRAPHRGDRSGLQAYRCSFCAGYHLGRSAGRQEHRRRFKDEALLADTSAE